MRFFALRTRFQAARQAAETGGPPARIGLALRGQSRGRRCHILHRGVIHVLRRRQLGDGDVRHITEQRLQAIRQIVMALPLQQFRHGAAFEMGAFAGQAA